VYRGDADLEERGRARDMAVPKMIRIIVSPVCAIKKINGLRSLQGQAIVPCLRRSLDIP
jgi:hypothetical protein